MCTILAGGCTTFSPRAGFDDVHSLATQRLGTEIVWRSAGEEDEQVETHIRELLARPLTADDVVTITLLNNLELQATYEELGIAQADLVSSGFASNPTVSIERRMPGKAFESDVALGLLDIFLIPLRQRIAGAAFEAAKLRITSEVISRAFEAREAYVDLQEKMQLAELAEQIASTTEASAESARQIRAAGNIPLLAVQREELAAGEAALESVDASGNVVEARERLNRLMGLWGAMTSWSVHGRLAELPSDDALPARLEPVAIENRVDLAAAKSELEGVAEEIGVARISAFVPLLAVTGHYEREADGADSGGPSIELPVPVFDWGRAETGAARSRLARAERRYTGLAIEIRSEVRAAYARMKTARARATFLKTRALPLQAAVLDQTQQRYNGMLTGVFQLLEAKRGQIETAQKYVTAVHDYWVARTMLERAVGRTLPLPAGETSAVMPQPSEQAHEAHNHHGNDHTKHLEK